MHGMLCACIYICMACCVCVYIYIYICMAYCVCECVCIYIYALHVVCACVYIYIYNRACMYFREISRPYIQVHRNPNPTNPFLLMIVLFLCPPAPMCPDAPIQTHSHQYKPLHTYPHPILYYFYVYLEIT